MSAADFIIFAVLWAAFGLQAAAIVTLAAIVIAGLTRKG